MAHTRCPALEEGLRLATHDDVPRMAEVSVAGFKGSERFRYQRPGHEKYPEDAAKSMESYYAEQLQNPRVVVIVTEIPHPDDKDANLVVGVASWIFPEGSTRHGYFNVSNLGKSVESQDRDLSEKHHDILKKGYEKTLGLLEGKVICDKLVVHPDHQKKGHAKKMLSWGKDICDQDRVDQGVIPSIMGKAVYLRLGFESIPGQMVIPAHGNAEGFTHDILVYKAR